MISVTILTKDCEETLPATLNSVKAFEEVVVLDTGSQDATRKIAQSYPNVTLFEAPFRGFGEMHNLASSKASNDWILSIDSDEVVSQELCDAIISLKKEDTTVYFLQRDNYFNGKRIRWCAGWHPDRVARLYNRRSTQFTPDKVHEKIIDTGMRTILLKGPLRHTPYRSIGDFLKKMESYTTLFAEEQHGKKRTSFLGALIHGWFAFLKSYLLKRGMCGGKEGFIISLYNGQTTFYKYLKLLERAREHKD